MADTTPQQPTPPTEKKKGPLDALFQSSVWRSVFRHGYDDTPRNRVLQIAANVWLHLHPVKTRRHAIR